jgi:predicted rRNA methylase YqxC with S4 and FtsJ domains
VVKDERIRLQILEDIQTYATKELGLKNIQLSNSVIKGPKGNQETFLIATLS